MRKQSIKKNIVFQFLYQFIVLVIPLIISPYLTRVLGSENLGEYTYVNSIAYYFVIIANLGIAKYGQRLISSNSDNEEKLRKAFWSLYAIHFIISLIVTFVFLGFCVVFADGNVALYYIQFFYVASAIFDITWLFYGLENFKSVVIKNAVVKVIECVLIFLLVKNKTDIDAYAWIMSVSILIGYIILLPQAVKSIKPISIGFRDMLPHIRPLIILFVSVLAATLYTVFDKTLLGILSTKSDVAYYEYANKIISIPKQIIGVIGIVMFPRVCKLFYEEKFDEQKEYINVSMLIVAAMSSAFMFGIMALGRKFAVLYFGEEFVSSGDAMIWMAPLIIIIMVGDIIRSEYLVPARKDALYTICISISAFLNIILSIILIPYFGFYGAIVGTTIAELFGLVFQIICINKFYSFKNIVYKLVPFLVAGAAMFLCVKALDVFFPTTILYLLIEILAGGLIYVLLATIVIILFFKKEKALLLSVLKKKQTNKQY